MEDVVGNRGSQRVAGGSVRRRRTLRAGLLAAGLLCGACAAAPDALAVVVELRSGATVSYARVPHPSERLAAGSTFDASLTNLDYNGGPVMPSNTNYAVYWDPPGAPAFPPDYAPGINRYFEDLAHDSGGHENVDSIAAQYNDAEGSFANYSSHFGGALIDEDPFPASGCVHAPTCLTDEQIRSELVKFVAARHLPADLTHEYFLLTPEGVENCLMAEREGSAQEVCSKNVTDGEYAEYCAYHGDIPLEGGGELIYASDPFVDGKNCDEPTNHPNGSSDSALIGGLGQEHLASVTDPEPRSAWTDWGQETGEIADKCSTGVAESEYGTPLGKAGNGAAYNQLINGHRYWYEQEWSNSTHRCLQRLAATAEPLLATFTSEPLAGTEMSFNAGSTAGAGVKYNWQFNDAGHMPSKASTVETASQSVTHTFPATERFVVALTVLRSDGTSIGTARTVAVGDEGPTAAYSLRTGTPAAGAAIEFDGSSSSDPDGSVADYSWNFGDGSQGTGEHASHAYAQPGSYPVTLSITDASGQTATVSRILQVAPQKAAQTIAFTSSPPAGAVAGGPGYTPSASATSGLPVTFSSGSPAICSVSGSTVSFLATGICTVDAEQPGNADYEPAPAVQQSFSVGKGTQTITFLSAPPNPALPGGSYLVAAASSAGLAVTISSPTPAVCTVWHGTVTFIAGGECIVVAAQLGNANYERAQAQQSFSVVPAASPPGEAGSSPPAQAGAAPLFPPELLPTPDSRFATVSMSVNASTGAVAITESVRDPGTLSWLVTFANGRFGVFGASHARCTMGFEILGGRCRPARIVFAQGARTVALPGLVSFTAKPSAAAARALGTALARGRGLAVIVQVTFKSALGGAPVSHATALRVRTRR
jgi:PKD repeat protein